MHSAPRPGRPMTATRRLGTSVAAAAFALVIAACGSHAADDQAPPPAEVSYAQVTVRDVVHWSEFTGRVVAPETVELRPRVSGYIQSLEFQEGEEVAAGDVLFVIDERPYRAELARMEAELQRARSRRDVAGSEARRAEQLSEVRAVSQEEADQRQSAAAQAEADVLAARANLDVARLNLEYTRVRSPIAGRAGRALVTAGNLARADESLLTTIVSIDPVHVYFDGDEDSVLRTDAPTGGSTTGDPPPRLPVRVGLGSETGFPHEGRLDFLDNRVDPSTGTISARAVLANPDRRFTPGLFARVQVAGNGSFHALLVDDKAVLTDQDRKYVYVVGEDATAERRDIDPGPMVDGLRVVRSGLEPGDRVVVNGTQKIFFPGMPLQATEVPMQAPAALALERRQGSGEGSAQ